MKAGADLDQKRLALPPADHPFYERLNGLLSKRGFDAFAESACESFYAKVGRPGLPPEFTFAHFWSAIGLRGHRFRTGYRADSRFAGLAVVSGL